MSIGERLDRLSGIVESPALSVFAHVEQIAKLIALEDHARLDDSHPEK
jgi:hypothetical protein